MLKRNIKFILFGILAFVIAALVIDEFILKNLSEHEFVRQIVLSIVVTIFIGGLMYFMLSWFWPIFEAKKGGRVPHFLKNLVDFLIIAAGILFILIFVFHQPIFGFAAAGGLVTAAITVSLKEIVQDIFGAYLIDIDVLYRVGDWLHLASGTEGKVQDLTWRHTKLLTNDKTIVYVPNGHLINGQFTNMSQPEPSLMNTLEISLDHEVPVERVRRLVEGVVRTLDSLHQHQCHVYAHQTSEGGITYAIRYMIPEHGVWRQVRHDVIQAVTNALHMYNLKISETIGEYALSRAMPQFEVTPPLSKEMICKQSHLFRDAPENIVQKAASFAKRLTYQEGEDIIRVGEAMSSLYLIGEGAVCLQLKKDSKQTEQVLTFPYFFGEHDFHRTESSPITVKAKTDVLILELPNKSLKELLKEYPEGVEYIVHAIIERRKQLTQQIKQKKQDTKDKKNVEDVLRSEIKDILKII